MTTPETATTPPAASTIHRPLSPIAPSILGAEADSDSRQTPALTSVVMAAGGQTNERWRLTLGQRASDSPPRENPFRRGGGKRHPIRAEGGQARNSGKSSSANSPGIGPPEPPSGRSSASRARSSTRRILPEIVFGSSANSSRRIRL